MDNSKRNLIIFAVIFFIGCLFVGMISLIGVGALGYLMTTERTVIIEPTNESIINVPEITPTSANDTQTDEITVMNNWPASLGTGAQNFYTARFRDATLSAQLIVLFASPRDLRLV